MIDRAAGCPTLRCDLRIAEPVPSNVSDVIVTNKPATVLSVCGLLVGLLALAASYSALEASRSKLSSNMLITMAALLRDNQGFITELQSEPFVEKDDEILESYLVKLRRDGTAKTAPMKQRLDQLAENNTTLVALVTAYLPYAKSSTFTAEANKFRNYAIAWRDRWNSVMELFMAGGNYPAAGPPFPKEFAAATQAEIAAVR